MWPQSLGTPWGARGRKGVQGSQRGGAPRPCSVCGSPRLCRHRERRLIGARFGRWRGEIFGRYRCLTLRYSLLLSVWVDPSAEHISIGLRVNPNLKVRNRGDVDLYI